MHLSVTLNFREDLGQNFGSLFEARDANGRVLFGAGFQGTYNTYYRTDRYAVQLYVRPAEDRKSFSLTPLGRPGPDCGAYLFDFDGRVYAYAHRYERIVRSWDPSAGAWRPEPPEAEFRMRLGTGVLRLAANTVEYNGRPLLGKPDQGDYQSFYYALGRLFFYQSPPADDPAAVSRLWSCPWRPGQERVDPARAEVLDLTYPTEWTFVFGQLGRQVITVSNNGGVYVYDDRGWRRLREPNNKVSYQIYSAIPYYDRLRLGQYPTGELFEFDGHEVTHLPGAPPRIDGVSAEVREAQTTAIYGGDLLVGVWPWGEVWRHERDADRWQSLGRLFGHPPVTAAVNHPYEAETRAAGAVLNQWGQRVTSMVPLGDSLLISTSAKWPALWEPEKFPFLAPDKWRDYGQVYRLTAPGNLAATVEYKDGPTKLDFVIGGDELAISQDGRRLAGARIDPSLLAGLERAAVAWGTGIHGPLGIEMVEHSR